MSPAQTGGPGYIGRMSKPVRRRIAFLLAADLLLVGFLGLRTRGGTQFADEVSRIPVNVAPTALAGIGLTAIVCCGAMDLSIGSILGVSGTVFGLLYARGLGPAACFAACFVTAAALSALNGLLIRLLQLPALIVTLAGLAFYRGVALILSDLAAAGVGEQFTIVGDAFHAPGRKYATPILFAALAIACLWEACGKWPRAWLAVGDSETACRLSGMRPGRIGAFAFVISGLFLGLAALLDVTNHITIEPARLGVGFELSVIAAVVLGGTSVFGGQGSVVGTVLGAVFLYLLGPVLLYAGVNEYWRTAVQGGAIVAVIAVDCALGRRRKMMDELR